MITETGSNVFIEQAIADAIARLETGAGAAENDVSIRLARARVLLGEMSSLRHALASANANMAELYAELEEAKEAVDGASRAKSQFLATMSHELRTPIHGVLGMMELLAGTSLDASQRRMLETARRSAKSLLGIVGDALDFSKIEADRLELDATDFELPQLVDDVVELFSATAAQKGITIGRTIPLTVPRMVHGDALRIRQVLSNLVGNATKFTPQGKVEVEVSAVPRENGFHVRIAVSDTGIGISADVLARLFQPFAQADTSMARRFGGTGLGLAISRRLCRLMGGDLVATSEPGEGAVFVATMQLATATSPAANQDGEHATATSTPEFEGVRVLVVDDDEINATMARLVLESLGCVVHEAATGREACRIALRERLDVVLMDCHMPEVDGFDATREIRYLEQCGAIDGAGARRLPIIAATGSACAEERELCLASGMDEVLPKPFTQPALIALLRRCTRR